MSASAPQVEEPVVFQAIRWQQPFVAGHGEGSMSIKIDSNPYQTISKPTKTLSCKSKRSRVMMITIYKVMISTYSHGYCVSDYVQPHTYVPESL